MTETDIAFHAEAGGQLPSAAEQTILADWVRQIITHHRGELGPLTYIFCGDDYLHRMNVEYLQHDTLTDIITFPYDHFPRISGDLFISTERVTDNAREFGVPYRDELHRVMIHGVLHLCGQGDKSPAEITRMRELEEEALHLRPAALVP